MQRIRPAVSPCALSEKVHLIEALPWFWSDQGNDKLQIAGLTHDADQTVLRGSPETGSFSVFCYAGDRLLGIESVNRPADHVVGRKKSGTWRFGRSEIGS